MAKLRITPVDENGDYRQATITGLTVAEIVHILGFKANCTDDKSKVAHSWGFSVKGVRCGVWDYRGSQRNNTFSAFGPKDTLIAVFGAEHVSD